MRQLPCRRGTMVACLLLCLASVPQLICGQSPEVPPVPARYFNDYVRLVPEAVGQQLEQQLSQFERATKHQLIVAIYSRYPPDVSIRDYTLDTARKWGVGRKGFDDGVVLFVFTNSHQIYIQIGSGMEKMVPNAIAETIIHDDMLPHFRKGEPAAGIEAGVSALIAALSQ